MTNQSKKEFPATGGFPGYETSSRLFLAITKALRSQADLLNGAWSNLKSGTYSSTQAMTLLAKSLEIPAELIKDLWLLPTGGEFVPVWVHIFCKADGAGAARELRVTRLLTAADKVVSTPLSLLGPAKEGKAVPSLSYETTSQLLTVKAESGVQTGQYMGLLYVQQAPSPPLAIVLITVEPALQVKSG
jgi:hypothetical protein